MTPLARLLVTTLAAASCALPGHAPAETDYNQVGRAVATVLANRHFSRQKLNADFDQQFIDHMLRQLDPNRMYFLQEDIDWIDEQFSSGLHEAILDGRTMDIAEPIYRRYQERMKDRHSWVEQRLAEGEFDLNRPDTTYQIKREDADWSANINAANDLWERRLTDELIRETLRRRVTKERRAELAANEEAEAAGTTTEGDSTETGLADNSETNDGAVTQPEGEAIPLPVEDEGTPAETLQKRYHRIAEDIETLSREDIADLFLSNLATSFDPHTDYMSFSEQQNFMQQMNNSLIGIGALLSGEDDGSTKIEGIVVGGPADLQGELQIDDRIIGVDTLNSGEMVDTLFMRLDRVVELIRGEAGTDVRLKLHPAEAPDDVREIVISRNEVELKDQLCSADLYQIDKGEGKTERLGWITVPSFYASWDGTDQSSVTRDVEALLRRLMSEGVDGIVLDLRNNGGGVLDEAVNMTGLFIERGPVVQIAGHFGDSEEMRSFNREPVYDGPLAVVTSRLSASASEILAGALQDYNRAVIVGDERTFGKGTVQRVIDVARHMPLFSDRERAGLVKVTEQKFYRPSGISTQLDGVTSDVILPSIYSAYDIGEASEQNPLAHDEIAHSNFEALDRDNLYLDALRGDSEGRVANSPEFSYVKEDIETITTEQARTEVVLDVETRYQQLQQLEDRRRARASERREHLADLAERDEGKIQVWHLTMENVDDPQLHELAEFNDEDHMRRGDDDELDVLTSSPEYPNDLDPMKRETIAILDDLIQHQTSSASVARSEDEEPASARR